MTPPRWQGTIVGLLAATASIGLAGCRSDNVAGSPSVLLVAAGANQTAQVGTVVATAPAVVVEDGDGTAVPGVTVHFTVLSGGGSVIGDSVKTDAGGRATVGQWALGTTPGTNTLRASVSSSGLTATITATAIAGNGVALRLAGQQGYLALVGQTVAPAPSVLVIDSYGNPVAGTTVTFAVTQGGGSVTAAQATTGANGLAQVGSWTLGTAAGLNTLRAQVSGGASLTFTAQALTSAPILTATSPTAQAGYLGFPVTSIPRVLVKDALGHPLSGVPVTFTETSGDAVVTAGSATSGTDGVAAPGDWRMGHSSSSTLTAATGLGAIPVSFSATGVAANFLIDLRFMTTMSADQRDAFVAAARRWMAIITAHLTPVTVNLPAGACATLQPAMSEVVTDVVIFAEATQIDGPGNILGSASPCASRSSDELTVVGTMQFDSADLQVLLASNQLVATITHEMAHVLGFGTTWSSLGLVTGLGGNDPRFTGPEAVSLWPPFATALGFVGTTLPVENCGGAGTAGAHWREKTTCGGSIPLFGAELMTGYLDNGVPTPLSRLTIAAMKDLGYQVDYSQADSFAGNLRAAEIASAPPMLINERIGRALWSIDPGGVVTKRE